MLKHLLVAAVALTATAAFAAPKNVTVAHGNTVTIFHGAPANTAVHQQLRPHGATIFSNLVTAYNCCTGWTLSGSPSSPIGQQIFLAEAFTPATAATAKEIDVAVSWVTGNNGVTIGLYTDAGGVPGTKIAAKTVKNLSGFGSSSSAVAVAKVKAKLAAGTQYWVTLTFTKKFKNEWAAWNWTQDNSNAITAAVDSGSGWSPTQLSPAGGFAVYD